MPIKNVNQNQRVKVLLRLLDNHENIEIASSKAGLNVEVAKKYLSSN
ncbi:MAG: hypothetical protein ACI9RG_001383 [Sulfurimonas sp.]|jgi:hypothetical protein|nr:hypothetical protein [Sulfurimonas sp.]